MFTPHNPLVQGSNPCGPIFVIREMLTALTFRPFCKIPGITAINEGIIINAKSNFLTSMPENGTTRNVSICKERKK